MKDKILYEDLVTNRRFLKINGVYREIPSEQEHLYRGWPVSHGYMNDDTMQHTLWINGMNETPTIEDLLQNG